VKIIADENMPAVAQLFAPYGEVRLLPGRTLTQQDVADVQVLLVRSVTQVNAALLANSAVEFVGSATIGMDHIDVDYLARRNIPVAHAPGCNAEAVVDYVLATLFRLETHCWFDKTVAIVGCGNVGSRLYKRLAALGVKCFCYDPFLTAAQQADLCDWEQLDEADIICLHTPLTTSGAHPTHHLFDDEKLSQLKPGALLINAGRGGAIANDALLRHLNAGRLRAALDVWEREPAIDRALLERVEQGSPHIAGYSLEGRLRGTVMVYEAFCRWRGSTAQESILEKMLDDQAPTAHSLEIMCPPDGDDYQKMKAITLAAYDPQQDFRRMQDMASASTSLAEGFDLLRRHYPLRREFGFYRVGNIGNTDLANKLQALGFNS